MKSHQAHASPNKRRKWLLVAAIVLLALPLAALENAHGAAFQVNTTSDEDDAGVRDGVCATANGQCTLRAAIQEANALPGTDSVGFAIPATDPGFDPGTERSTINLKRTLPDLSTNLEINGPGANKLTVRRNSQESYSVFRVTTIGVVTLSGMTITRGFSNGGGILNVTTGTVNVTGCAVSGNSAGEAGGGGGIYNGSAGTVNITNSTISGNFAEIAGGISNPGGTVNIINSTVAGNSGSGHTGGIFNDVGAVLNITNSTITGNSSSSTGGVFNNGGTVTLKSSIIALNTGNLNPDIAGSFKSAGYNLIGDAKGSPGFGNVSDQSGTSAAPLDPKLDPNGLQSNGGPTQTVALLFGSPAIDKGTSNGLFSDLATDQRAAGFARIVENSTVPNNFGSDGTDIGAFEVQSSSTTPGLSTLANISTRALVQTGDNVLIAGFIIVGSNPKKVIVRALGPSLAVSGKLADPTLELRDQNGGLLGTNDNWRSGGQETEIINTTIPPTNDLESAIVATLPANNASYTAIVRGVSNTTGIAVVEVYALN